MALRGVVVAVSLALVRGPAAPRLNAQISAGSANVRVAGEVYDSLRRVPLRAALVAMIGTSKTAVTDSLGRFHFDDVVPGQYVFTVQDASLDAIGLSGISARVTVTNGDDIVRIATPSFAALWRAACGETGPPPDGGLIFGTVSSASTHAAAAGADIRSSWLDVAFDGKSGFTQHRFQLASTTDAAGSYALCGAPRAIGVSVQASENADSSGVIELAPRDVPVRRLDLVVARSEPDAGRRGWVAGTVTSEGGVAVEAARVSVDRALEIRTDAQGKFVARGVAGGTRQVEVFALGMSPAFATVDVSAGDTTAVSIELHKIVMLDSVRVMAPLTPREHRVADINERRQMGFGIFRDSTEIGRHPDLVSVFGEMPSVRIGRDVNTITLPGMTLGRCSPNFWLDGVPVQALQVTDLQPADVAFVEVYVRMSSTPSQFIGKKNGCGSIVIWTKRAMP